MMEVYASILKLLDTAEVQYKQIHHEATPTSEDSARVRGDALSSGAKAIVYKVQDEFCLFVCAANHKLDPKLIKIYLKAQGKRVKKTRFATSEELMQLTGLIPGSVPPFGRPILGLDLYVDPSLLSNEMISFNAGSITDSIKMPLKDYVNITKPTVFDFTLKSLVDD